MVIPRDRRYGFGGSGTYLVVNTPAFEVGDDAYVIPEGPLFVNSVARRPTRFLPAWEVARASARKPGRRPGGMPALGEVAEAGRAGLGARQEAGACRGAPREGAAATSEANVCSISSRAVDASAPLPAAPDLIADAVGAGGTRVRGRLPHQLLELAGHLGAERLAREECFPAAVALRELLGSSGLRRGSTIVVHGHGAAGTTSLALGLLAEASASGRWCAAVGFPALGLAAAGELGVAFDRLCLVPVPGARFGAVVGALLDGCDVVLAAPPARLGAAEARRLSARARERRSVLVVVTGSPAAPAGGRWPEAPDVLLSVSGGCALGLEQGSGRITALRIAVDAQRRRTAVPATTATLQLPWPQAPGTPVDHGPAERAREGAIRSPERAHTG